MDATGIEMTRGRDTWAPIAVAAGAALATAVIGGLLTDTDLWYQSLLKPGWQPPDWLFAPVWISIFALTAISGVAAWRRASDANSRRWVFALFAANAILNVLWSALFFALKRPDFALIEVVFLWLSVLLPIVLFWRGARSSSYLLLPYLAWVSFAAVLNLAVVRLNAPFG